ncbi:MAG TPA: zinc-binding alcohol dehydrogenase [Vicinamibacterales bacterium]|nr:zinc-binding alcohol dehydrogenase [Vicinamibacterales bacterium]
MQQEVRAFWVTAPGCGEIRTERLATPATDEVVVRTVYSGVSRGTEALVFGGHVPPGEWQRMRAPFQSGNFPAPIKYGYSSVGIVEHGPAELVGRAVFALYPHQTRYLVPVTAVHRLPEAVPPARAVLAANMETALNGMWDARPHVGDRVAVVGAGTVGCLTAWLASRIAGCRVELVDINTRRAEAAAALGVPFADGETAVRDADVVIHASGSPEGLELALSLAGFETTITELSWFADKRVSLPLGGAFHARRLSVASSQVGTIPAAQRGRWTTTRRMQLALSLLEDPALDVLITGESEFDALPEVMAMLTDAPGETLCHRIRY